MEESTPAPAAAPPSSEQQQPSVNPQPQPPPSTASPPVVVSVPNPEPEAASKPSNAYQGEQSGATQTRPAFNTRPWQQPSYSHFSLPPPPLPSASTSSSIPAPRGTVSIGVPAHSATIASPSPIQQSQIKQPPQVVGTAPAPPIWPTGIPSHQPRPPQSSLRPQAGSSGQSPALQPQSQPWQSSGLAGKPPLPTTSVRAMQQRSYISPLQHHNLSSPLLVQPTNSSQQSVQSLAASQQQEQHGQPSTKQSLAHQRVARGAGLGGHQRPNLGMNQSGVVNTGAPGRAHSADVEESPNRIINKRSIKDIAHQIDPSETLDPEVETILMDIAEEYLESIVTFGCSLAKHRKSSTLEVKDILLHVERNWNIALPGFSGDEIKTFKKPVVADIHKERLAAVKKSIMVADKNSAAPATGNAKSHLAKGLPASSGHP